MTDTTPAGNGDLIKRLRAMGDDDTLSIGQAWNALHEAADALEAAERVIAERVNQTYDPDDMCICARDWLARHATGQQGGDDD